MPAYYRQTLARFLGDDADQIVGRLTGGAAAGGFYQQKHTQTISWQVQVGVLRLAAEALVRESDGEDWQILLEYPIPRRGKRIDTVIVAGDVLVVLEFKCGAREHGREGIAQVEDYCLDLGDFHKESAGRVIVPVVVATEAGPRESPADVETGLVKPTWLANRLDLPLKLVECLARYRGVGGVLIDPARWDSSDYTPTPTIIEAAQELYAGKNVREISRSHSGIENLTRTTDSVIGAIEEAKTVGRKRICFITGVPGAGKTLAGLNIVHNKELHEGDLGVFLSGNVPLVRVLTEALARDAAARLGQPREQARRRVETFIQNVHRFIETYYSDPAQVPVDRVVVFDEAQRAWNAAQAGRKFNRECSEPETLLEIMDRHSDWSVIVALIGGGQEINRGEAGLSEWGRALAGRFPHWEILVSPDLKAGVHATGACLFEELPEGVAVLENPSLHLSVNLRSYKAEVLSQFVEAVLYLDQERARELSGGLKDYPIVLTRDLDLAKGWLRERCRGLRRVGLVASSGGRRLRAHGLDVTTELDVENWFLNGPDDVRSSHYLEVPATEFGVQGLELDWTGVCWGGDLHPKAGRWNCRAFRGTRWQQIRDPEMNRYIVNKYRVLLTRAREGVVIWVPPGDRSDPTRPPDIYDAVAGHLDSCGVASLDRDWV